MSDWSIRPDIPAPAWPSPPAGPPVAMPAIPDPAPAPDALTTAVSIPPGKVIPPLDLGVVAAPLPRRAAGGEPAAGTAARRVCDALGSEAAARFRRLSVADQEQFTALYQVCGLEGQLALGHLLASGDLALTGQGGRTLLQNLTTFMAIPLTVPAGNHPEVYRREQLGVLLQHVETPRTIFQANHGTCGVTVPQHYFAANAPADYVAVATGLLSTAGQARMPDGSTIVRVPDSLSAHAWDRRPPVSRILQAAFMDWASAGEYSNRADAFVIDLPLLGVRTFGGGTNHVMSERLMATLSGRRLDTLETPGLRVSQDGVSANLLDMQGTQLLAAVESDLHLQARRGFVPAGGMPPTRLPMTYAGIDWSPAGSHAIGVTRISRERVFFWNPHGNRFPDHRDDEKGRPRPLLTDAENGRQYVEARSDGDGPLVRFYTDGTQSMERADFAARLTRTVVGVGIARQTRDQQRIEL